MESIDLGLLPTEKSVLSLFRTNFPKTKQTKISRFDLNRRFYTLYIRKKLKIVLMGFMTFFHVNQSVFQKYKCFANYTIS